MKSKIQKQWVYKNHITYQKQDTESNEERLLQCRNINRWYLAKEEFPWCRHGLVVSFPRPYTQRLEVMPAGELYSANILIHIPNHGKLKWLGKVSSADITSQDLNNPAMSQYHSITVR